MIGNVHMINNHKKGDIFHLGFRKKVTRIQLKF